MRNNRQAFVLLAGIAAAILGCRQEKDSAGASTKAVDPGELRIQEAFNLISDWQFRGGEYGKYRDTMVTLDTELYRIGDPARRKKHLSRFAEIVFSYPLDATDPGTRDRQFLAFTMLSDSASSSAYGREEIDIYWEICLRRLKRIKDERLKVEAYFGGKGEQETFKGDRDGWNDYRERVNGTYEECDRCYSRVFGDWKTASSLPYERWLSIRSQLEEILGHEVKVWRPVLEYWEEKRRKKSVSGTNAPVAARTKLPYRRYERFLRDAFFLDARGTAGAEKFGWRVERDVQGCTNVIGQAQGGNGP